MVADGLDTSAPVSSSFPGSGASSRPHAGANCSVDTGLVHEDPAAVAFEADDIQGAGIRDAAVDLANGPRLATTSWSASAVATCFTFK
jgi:hypothetical protein